MPKMCPCKVCRQRNHDARVRRWVERGHKHRQLVAKMRRQPPYGFVMVLALVAIVAIISYNLGGIHAPQS